MYINKIDELFDNILNNVYKILITINVFEKILNEANFSKYQKDINEILITIIKTINKKEIKEIVINDVNVDTVFNVISRYISYYLFLMIGHEYKGNDNAYIGNIIDFTTNQNKYELKINNFFNIESNSKIIKYFNIIRQIQKILETEKEKLYIYKDKIEYSETILLLNKLGAEYVNNNFRIKDKFIKAHNIIKTIIIVDLYKEQERKNIFYILENSSNDDGEFIYIDIVIPIKKQIDLSAIENVLINKNDAYDFYNMLVKDEQFEYTDINMKIKKLMESKMFIPISEDFILCHNDSEKYDKLFEKTKKKEDTKMKYIVTKIEKVTELYSKNNDETKIKEIKEEFFPPLNDRNGILINNNEEIDMINKLITQNVKNSEYFGELANYRIYPFINFKDFSNYGINIVLENNIDLLRGINFTYKQLKNSTVQTRVGNNVNVIGLAFPSNLNKLECIPAGTFLDIRKISKIQNGYDLSLDFLKSSVIDGIKHNSSVYWLFDLEKDIIHMNNYEQENTLTQTEQIKLILNKMYDDIQNMVYNKIKDIGETSIKNGLNYLDELEERTMQFDKNSDIYADILEEIYFNKSKKIVPKYDTKEDIFYGISGDIIELPYATERKINKVYKVYIKKSKKSNSEIQESDLEKHIGICQHNITWDYISSIKKIDPNKFMNMIYSFNEQFVTENNEHEYICKSCFGLLNIKKFIEDGAYDKNTGKFVTFSSPIEVPLDEIKEYEKMKGVIRNLDKLIEKIANASNIPYFVGMSTRWRRKILIKNAMDLIMENNIYYKKKMKERDQMKLYNIDRSLTNIFYFELENDIFVFTSNEKDYYKERKNNNIVSYVIILILIELNEGNILYMTGDLKGLCNYQVFEKYGHLLFGELKILINKNKDTEFISKYKVLCYVLYIISCVITKYGMWNFDYPDGTADKDKKKFGAKIQKIIIHTTIDILNNIIENSNNKTKSHIYDIVSLKYFSKLTTLFNDDDLYNRFRYDVKKVVEKEKENLLIEKILLSGYYEQDIRPAIFVKCTSGQYSLPLLKYNNSEIYKISPFTNCITGNFHKWTKNGKIMTCSICNMTSDSESTKVYSKDIEDKYVELKNQEISKKYCIKGGLHVYINFKCIKCGNKSDKKYTGAEINSVFDVINKSNISVKEKENEKEKEKEKDYENKVLNKLKEEYSKIKINKFIYEYVEYIYKSIGKIVGSNENFFDNIYIIDHLYNGYPLPKPITLTEKENKIKFATNHPFFKKDVIYYTSTKTGKIDVFYDGVTFILLGYKEESKDYVIMNNPEKKIKIEYSIYEKIKNIGYQRKIIKIDDLQGDTLKDKTNNLARERISNIKKIIREFIRAITRIKNKYVNKKKIIEEESTINIDKIVDKHYKKIMNISLVNENGEHKVFKHWKAVLNKVNYADINLQIDGTIIDIDKVSELDEQGNLLLFYLLSEMKKLFSYNSNGVIKNNLIMFYLEMLDTLFNYFSLDHLFNDFDSKLCYYLLKYSSNILYLDVESDTYTVDAYSDRGDELTEEEIAEMQDDQEMAEALDMDTKFNYQATYDRTYWEEKSIDDSREPDFVADII